MIRNSVTVALLLAWPNLASAQNFTTAAEISAIIDAIRDDWIAVREWEGNDLIYFTNPMAWRCGMSEIRYGLNGAPAETVLPMEPCYEDLPNPNVLLVDQGVDLFVTEALKSVQTVSVVIVLDDGSEKTAEFKRADVIMP